MEKFKIEWPEPLGCHFHRQKGYKEECNACKLITSETRAKYKDKITWMAGEMVWAKISEYEQKYFKEMGITSFKDYNVNVNPFLDESEMMKQRNALMRESYKEIMKRMIKNGVYPFTSKRGRGMSLFKSVFWEVARKRLPFYVPIRERTIKDSELGTMPEDLILFA